MKTMLGTLALSLALTSFSPPPAAPPVVGPPLICHPFAIGDARSLPWSEGTQGRKDYDRSKLVADVAEILKTESDLVVRMETLRRAAIYAREDRAIAWELVGRRGLGVLEQATAESKQSIAWFDVAFLVGCFDQLGLDLGFRAGVHEDLEGYGYMLRALEQARREGNDQVATIEFASALIAHAASYGRSTPPKPDRYANHLAAARAGAAQGSLLAKNVAMHDQQFRPRN